MIPTNDFSQMLEKDQLINDYEFMIRYMRSLGNKSRHIEYDDDGTFTHP